MKFSLTGFLLACTASLLGLAIVQMQATLPAAHELAWLCVAALSLLWSAKYLTGPWWRRMALALAFGMLGFSYAAWRAQGVVAEQLPPEWEGRDISVRGLISSLPQATRGLGGDTGWRFQFDVESVSTPGALVPGRLLLASYGHGDLTFDQDQWRVGDRWQLNVRLRRPHGLMNPHSS